MPNWARWSRILRMGPWTWSRWFTFRIRSPSAMSPACTGNAYVPVFRQGRSSVKRESRSVKRESRQITRLAHLLPVPPDKDRGPSGRPSSTCYNAFMVSASCGIRCQRSSRASGHPEGAIRPVGPRRWCPQSWHRLHKLPRAGRGCFERANVLDSLIHTRWVGHAHRRLI